MIIYIPRVDGLSTDLRVWGVTLYKKKSPPKLKSPLKSGYSPDIAPKPRLYQMLSY